MTDDRILALVSGILIGCLLGGGLVTLSLAMWPTIPPFPLPGPGNAQLPPSEHMLVSAFMSISVATILGLVAVGELIGRQDGEPS